MQHYMEYSGNLVSVPHIQDFLAIKELKERGKISEDTLFVPGHQGMVAGGLMHSGTLAGNPIHRGQLKRYTFEILQKDIIKYYYSLWSWVDTNEIATIFKNKIQMSIGEINIDDVEKYSDVLEFFEFKERKSKFIVNSVRAYEFFTCGWRLPLLDTELTDFFLKVPLMLRLKQMLYREYVVKKLFIGPLETLQILDSTTSLGTDNEHYTSNDFIYDIKFFLSKLPLLGNFGKNIYMSRRVRTQYDSHPLAWYGILPKDRFLQVYSGTENINSFVGLSFINRVCPYLLSDLVKKYFRNADRMLSAL